MNIRHVMESKPDVVMEATEMARRTIGVLCLVLIGLMPGVARVQTEQVYYYHSDAIGSVRMITNASGQEITRYDFWPFGQVSGSPTVQDSRMFTGTEHDGESEFDYFGARYLSAVIARFTSPDPRGGYLEHPQTLNRYAYSGNNPLRFMDPTGLDFYLQCERESDTCHEGHVGKTVNSVFAPTIVTSASLSDPKSPNIATVNSQGVIITTDNGVYQGIFINHTPAADIEGSGLFSGFSFHIDHSSLDQGVLSAGSASFVGDNLNEAISRLRSQSFTYFGAENLLSEHSKLHTHPYSTNLRFANGLFPEIRDYGPSPHFVIANTPGASAPVMEFHVDKSTNAISHSLCVFGHIGC
jgi:RHS repeat-associated protein